MLERNSVGEDIDISSFGDFGDLVTYPVTGPEVTERIADADIVIVNKARITRQALEGAKNLKMIQEFATGYDNIDIQACKERGIAVANVSGYSTDSVAQHTLTMALALTEQLSFYDGYVKTGAYSAQNNFSNFEKAYNELSSMTWGVIGMGAIGQRVAGIAKAFGCKVIFHSVTGNSKVTEYERVSFDELLAQSDILSLHCPLSDKTHHIIDAGALSKMKKEAILINVARGAVVDTKALAEAVQSGQIGGAGLDVFEKEPLSADDPLLAVTCPEKLLLTPHMAWGSVQARTRLVREACSNIRAFLEGDRRNRIV